MHASIARLRFKIAYSAAILAFVLPNAALALDPGSCDLVNDGDVRAVSNIAKPGYLKSIVDPQFGTTITRVTGDPGAPIANIPGGVWGAVSRHHFSVDEAWNADMSLLYIDRNAEGGTPGGAIFLDGRTYQPLFARKPPGEGIRWDVNSPDHMIYGSGETLGSWNVRTGATSVIAKFPGYDVTIKGNLSNDGRKAVLAGRNPHGDAVFFAYDMAANRKYPDIQIPPQGDVRNAEVVSISPAGDYLVTTDKRDNAMVFDLNGHVVQSWTEYGRPSHYDLVQDHQGVEWAVGLDKSGAVGQIIKRRLSDGTVFVLTHGRGWPSHVSGRNLRLTDWVFATYPSPADLGPGHPLFAGEIVAIKLDGSQIARLGNHHGWRADYLSENHASPSPDGMRVVFASNWGASSGRPIQDYVLDLRPTCGP